VARRQILAQSILELGKRHRKQPISDTALVQLIETLVPSMERTHHRQVRVERG
jgi:hypothetical protein